MKKFTNEQKEIMKKHYTQNIVDEIFHYVNKKVDLKNMQNYLVNPTKQAKIFINFYGNLTKGKIKGKILEFGPGAGFGLYWAKQYGYEINGIDIDQKKLRNMRSFDDIKSILGVNELVKFYNGHGKMPFEKNEFSHVFAKNSIHHVKRTDNKKLSKEAAMIDRVNELSRICEPKAVWFIYGTKVSKMCRGYLNKIGNPKKIKVRGIQKGKFIN